MLKVRKDNVKIMFTDNRKDNKGNNSIEDSNTGISNRGIGINYISGTNNGRGNIVVLVLIIGLVVILSASALISFVMRDIKFTKLDEEKLMALNFAEAGLSNMYLNIDKYSKGEIPNLPQSPYTENIIKDGEVVGSYTVEYETYSTSGEYPLYGYVIVSKGIDKSGVERTVKVDVLSFNIYNFIFTQNALNTGHITAGRTTIVGPFFINEDLNLRGRVSFLEGPLMVGENIILGGNSSIGEEENPIDLYLGGIVEDVNGREIDPLNPSHNEDIYIDNLYTNVVNISMLNIDDDYINSVVNSGALVVEGDLYIKDGGIEVDGETGDESPENYIHFNDDIPKIGGNIVVYGNIYIGERTGRKYTIYYQGKANLISTEGIYVYSQLVPASLNSFPEDDLLVLISKHDIELDLKTSLGGSGYYDPNAAIVAIADSVIEVEENVILRGNLISETLILDNNSIIYYEQDIGSFLPGGVPSYDNIIFTQNWQEIVGE